MVQQSRPTGVLRSVRALRNFRLVSAEGVRCGLVKDLYFDDQHWAIKYVVAALEPRQFRPTQVLLAPEQIFFDDEAGALRLSVLSTGITHLPLVDSVRPVCKQYAAFSLGSPGACHRRFEAGDADPHLRSCWTVSNYKVAVGDDVAGTLADFLIDDQTWEIRNLAVDHEIDGRKVAFHILPQTVERVTWATQRIALRLLLPVELAVKRAASFSDCAA
jgi:hypothetical protein